MPRDPYEQQARDLVAVAVPHRDVIVAPDAGLRNLVEDGLSNQLKPQCGSSLKGSEMNRTAYCFATVFCFATVLCLAVSSVARAESAQDFYQSELGSAKVAVRAAVIRLRTTQVA
jgi:hypothetical protein